MRGEYKTASYTLKAQKVYRERNAEKIAEKARVKYQQNKEAILQKLKEKRDAIRAETYIFVV